MSEIPSGWNEERKGRKSSHKSEKGSTPLNLCGP
jgi:hypothetical protein